MTDISEKLKERLANIKPDDHGDRNFKCDFALDTDRHAGMSTLDMPWITGIILHKNGNIVILIDNIPVNLEFVDKEYIDFIAKELNLFPENSEETIDNLRREHSELDAKIIRTSLLIIKNLIPEGHMAVINPWGHSTYIEDMPVIIYDNSHNAPYPEYTRRNPYAVRNNNGTVEVSLTENKEEYDSNPHSFIPLEHCSTFGSISAESVATRLLNLRNGTHADNHNFELVKFSE